MKPQPVDAVMMSFPANVVGTLLPPWDTIPEEFRRGWTSNRWCQQAETWFYQGVDPTKSVIESKQDIDLNEAVRHLQVCLGSYEPKHEHKMAGVGYLMSLWFDKLELVGREPL